MSTHLNDCDMLDDDVDSTERSLTRGVTYSIVIIFNQFS